MKYKDKTCNDFINELASKAPVPGGGGASALVGSIGVALGAMVGNLTIGKNRYENVEPDLMTLIEKSELLQRELLDLIDKDAEAFEPLARAYRLPSDNEELEKEKEIIMEEALRTACTAPLKIMEQCCGAIELHNEYAVKGSEMVISDVGCGAVFCKAALLSASLNVFINTKLMKDRGYAMDINTKANSMLDRYIPLADEIFSDVRAQL